MIQGIHDVYLCAALRTPVARAGRGAFRLTRPDDLLAHCLKTLLQNLPQLPPQEIKDVIVGCAMPEAEQGMNVARIALLLAGYPNSVPGVTVNRFCASGLQAISMAADRIRLGEADIMVAAGTESMSLVPMMGHKVKINPALFAKDEHIKIAYGMGITAEKVAKQWKISREEQDSFALESHRRALLAQTSGEFQDEISPYTCTHHVLNSTSDSTHGISAQFRTVKQDEGPRPDTTLSSLAALKPVFAAGGSVTAGNSSQMSDGAAAILLASENGIKRHGLTPLVRFVGYTVVGVDPEIMGIGPIPAVSQILKQTGLKQEQIEWIELNEAFAAQSLAVIKTLGLDTEKVNPLGGAIALGHPLGATGAIRTATLAHGLKRHGKKYGMVTMCVGTGMGAACIFENIC